MFENECNGYRECLLGWKLVSVEANCKNELIEQLQENIIFFRIV